MGVVVNCQHAVVGELDGVGMTDGVLAAGPVVSKRSGAVPGEYDGIIQVPRFSIWFGQDCSDADGKMSDTVGEHESAVVQLDQVAGDFVETGHRVRR